MDTDKKLKKGFSLSENLTVLFVLGIIIAITVPKLVSSKTERNNRLLVRKAIVTYQGILDKELASATGIRSTNALSNRLINNNCALIKSRLSLEVENGCNFTTEDGVRWNLTSGASDAVISIKNSAEPSYENAQSDNLQVFYIPFAVNRRTVKVLEFDTNVNNNLQQRTNTLNKTRNFIMGE